MMRTALQIAVVVVVMSRIASLPGADPNTDNKSERSAFVVYSPGENSEFSDSLIKRMRDRLPDLKFSTAETLAQAVASDAEVLVLVMPHAPPQFGDESLAEFKKRKIIGFGGGAGNLFQQLGLEIVDGVHGTVQPPTLTVVGSQLLGAARSDEPVHVLDEAHESRLAELVSFELIGLHQPSHGPDAEVVDTIARWSKDPNYTPLARHGNCVRIGVLAPPTWWSAPYTDLIANVFRSLHDRELEPFSTAQRELTAAGTYEFQLAPLDRTDKPYNAVYFFKFSDAKQLTARLEHAGSGAVMMLFMGESAERPHWTREDAPGGQPLTIKARITKEDIETLGDRYWSLKVTNFDGSSSVDCKLSITIDDLN